MQRFRSLILATILTTGAAPLHADTEGLLSQLPTHHTEALAMVHAVVADEAGPRTIVGPAVCVDDSGVLMTLAFNHRVRPASLRECRILLPGAAGTSLEAELLTVDPLTGLGFVRTKERHPWKAVRFVDQGDPTTGQQVVSVGLMTGQPGYPVYVGAAYVSAVIRTPARLAYVTGGKLTSQCSPVFDKYGEAIGIVAGQAMVQYQMQAGQTSANVALTTNYETGFFLPTSEFRHVLKAGVAKSRPQRLPWLGVNTFEAVDGGVALKGLMPNQPATDAGLAEGDIVTKFNGAAVEQLATPMLTTRNFLRDVMRIPAGREVVLTVLRQGATIEKTVMLAEMPTLPAEARRFFHPGLGMILRETVMLDSYLDNPPPANVAGMVVAAVATDSPAAAAGLQIGDFVRAVNGKAAADATQVKDILAAMGDAPSVDLVIHRGPNARKLTLAMPTPAPQE